MPVPTSAPPHVVVAPDKFKGCLSAEEVAHHLDEGLRSGGVSTVVLPVADGGEGTVDSAVRAGFSPVTIPVAGPDGRMVSARYARRRETAVVEMAQASGLHLVTPGPASAVTATSAGTGQLVMDAVRTGAREIVVGLGGSATTDAGVGMLSALGARWMDRHGGPIDVTAGVDAWHAVASVDLAPLRRRLDGVGFQVACDVDNPLLGPTGAAAIFAPQKGAGPLEVERLERGLQHVARVLRAAIRQDLSTAPGAGAAGGVGFAALAVLHAERRPGIDTVLDLLGFDDHLRGADLVVTGEGHLDEQSLAGKAPVGVARRAHRAGVRTVAVAGRVSVTAARLRAAHISDAYALIRYEPDPERSIRQAPALLRRIGAEIAAGVGASGRSPDRSEDVRAR
jgi:glycerate kinase